MKKTVVLLFTTLILSTNLAQSANTDGKLLRAVCQKVEAGQRVGDVLVIEQKELAPISGTVYVLWRNRPTNAETNARLEVYKGATYQKGTSLKVVVLNLRSQRTPNVIEDGVLDKTGRLFGFYSNSGKVDVEFTHGENGKLEKTGYSNRDNIKYSSTDFGDFECEIETFDSTASTGVDESIRDQIVPADESIVTS